LARHAGKSGPHARLERGHVLFRREAQIRLRRESAQIPLRGELAQIRLCREPSIDVPFE